MVTDQARSAWRAIRADLDGFLASFQPAKPDRGLHTYRVALNGGKRRLHLRIEPDGAGVLFIDAMDVIHLNATATTLAKLALEGAPRRTAMAALRRGGLARPEDEVQRIYSMIGHLTTATDPCLTCALPELGPLPVFGTRARAPFKADLALTYGCNNSCSHCYNEPGRLDMASMDRDGWQSVLDKLAGVGVPHIIFTGGEATLHPELPEIVRYSDSLGQITGLNTNGRRIAKQGYMQTLADAGLSHVQVTLSSHRAELHDAVNGARAFHQTIRGIENALASDVYAITNTTLMRANVDEVETFIDFLYRLGIRTFAMNGMIYSGGGYADPNAIPEQEMAPILIRVRDKAAELGMRFLWYTPTEYCRMSPVELEIGAKRCNAGEYSICIEPNGDVLPCQSFYASAGNILRDPWEQIWQGELFRSFRERESDPRWAGLPEKCWECPDLPMCGGGCRIEREARDGLRTVSAPQSGTGTGNGFRPTPGLADTTVRASGTRAFPVAVVAEQKQGSGCGSSCGCAQ